ncbi:MAG: hypothetical protein LIP00_01205 [Parabacteroides sp.]|nr:hypothetical protein [Parabacteroides sp.]
MSGSNLALESILQKSNTYDAYDVFHIKKIHKKFGEGEIKNLTFISQFRRDYDRVCLGLKTVYPLDLIDYNYNKERAVEELNRFCGFRYYKAKHCENILTKVIQLRWFAEKFHVDKRRSHLSSLIVSGQITREAALKEMEKSLYDEVEMERDLKSVLNKLHITREEFEILLSRKGKQHGEYPVNRYYIWINRLLRIKSILKNRFL